LPEPLSGVVCEGCGLARCCEASNPVIPCLSGLQFSGLSTLRFRAQFLVLVPCEPAPGFRALHPALSELGPGISPPASRASGSDMGGRVSSASVFIGGSFVLAQFQPCQHAPRIWLRARCARGGAPRPGTLRIWLWWCVGISTPDPQTLNTKP
jgi:hypothetical protein